MNTSIETTAIIAPTLSPIAINKSYQVISHAKTLFKLLKRGSKKVRVWLTRVSTSHRDSYERYRELEYRNEMATRMGERMNLRSLC